MIDTCIQYKELEEDIKEVENNLNQKKLEIKAFESEFRNLLKK